MRLRLFLPPVLVHVRLPPDSALSALLLARRGERCFVQLHRGVGDNVLRWVPRDAVGASAEQVAGPASAPAGSTAVRPPPLQPPRAQR